MLKIAARAVNVHGERLITKKNLLRQLPSLNDERLLCHLLKKLSVSRCLPHRDLAELPTPHALSKAADVAGVHWYPRRARGVRLDRRSRAHRVRPA